MHGHFNRYEGWYIVPKSKIPLDRDESQSLILKTDGVRIFKSNKWPILLLINELPLNDR